MRKFESLPAEDLTLPQQLHTRSMIHLSKCSPFAIGGRRICYLHPDDDTLCIKILRKDKLPKDLKRADPWWKQLRSASIYDENINDLKNHIKMVARSESQLVEHIPKVHGIIPTDLGAGLVVELIRDADGSISLSLKEYIAKHGFDQAAEQALERLKTFLIEQLIPFRDPFPHNIALRAGQGTHLDAYVIDGLGNSSLLSFAQHIRPLARRHITKKCQRLDKAIQRTVKNRDNQVAFGSKGMLLRRN